MGIAAYIPVSGDAFSVPPTMTADKHLSLQDDGKETKKQL